jgi:hypothetical protein
LAWAERHGWLAVDLSALALAWAKGLDRWAADPFVPLAGALLATA